MTLEEKAVKAFGTTDMVSGAFFILPNGRLLDGSARNDGGTEGRRSLDHRSVCRIYDRLPKRGRSGYWSDESWALYCFMKRGSIRFMPESNWVELIKKPTPQQYRLLLWLVKKGLVTEIEVTREPENSQSATLTDIISVGQAITFLTKQFKGGF